MQGRSFSRKVQGRGAQIYRQSLSQSLIRTGFIKIDSSQIVLLALL
jgi:hypothetical protein